MIAGLMRNAGWPLATEDRVRRIWDEVGRSSKLYCLTGLESQDNEKIS